MISVLNLNDADMYYYNRKKDMKMIELQISSIYENLSNQILLTGKKGSGKTFLLKKILANKSANVLSVYVDISRIYYPNKKIDEEEIIKLILMEIFDCLEKYAKLHEVSINLGDAVQKIKLKLENIFNLSLDEIRNNYQNVFEFMLDLPQSIVNVNNDITGFIIVIDEFQLIKYVNNPETFFMSIKNHLQTQTNVCYIFSGSISDTSEAFEMLNGQNDVCGGCIFHIDIKSFTKQETFDYIKNRLPKIKFTDEGFDIFYKYTNGIPAYIDTFCNVLDSGELYGSKKIKETFLLKMDQIVIMWLYVWGRLNNHEKKIITTLADNDELAWSQLLEKCNFSKATLAKYIDSLNNQGLIKYTHENKYALNDEMIKTWLKHKKETEGQYPI